jgi:hypothetical protein|tara:strand:- start:580 stop:951 length:372 start_codon:yes stop_codon:yes gene_type:complete
MFGFIVKFGIKAAIKKYGKAAIMRIAKNHGLIKKSAEKTIPKKVGLTAKEMAKRDLMLEKKKAAIALKKFQAKNIKVVKKSIVGEKADGSPIYMTMPVAKKLVLGKGTGRGKKYKPYVPPKKP